MRPVLSVRVLMRRRQPFQHFQTPPQKVSGDQNAERHFHQLDDQFVFAHLIPRAVGPPHDPTVRPHL